MAEPPSGGGRWLRPKQVVSLYPISTTRLFAKMRDGVIERTHDGRRITYVSEESVKRYLDSLPRDKGDE